MYPFISSTVLFALHEAAIRDAQQSAEQQRYARPFIVAVGQTFVALGHQLERLGQ